MKNVLRGIAFVLAAFLFASSTYAAPAAGGNYSKDVACKLPDGLYQKNLEIFRYDGFRTHVNSFSKSSGTLYYVVNAQNLSDGKFYEMNLYSYTCRTKKPKQLSGFDFGKNLSFYNYQTGKEYSKLYGAEILAADKSHIIIKSSAEKATSWALYYVYDRDTQAVTDIEPWRDAPWFTKFTEDYRNQTGNWNIYERSIIITDFVIREKGIWDIRLVFNTTGKWETKTSTTPKLTNSLRFRIDWNKRLWTSSNTTAVEFDQKPTQTYSDQSSTSGKWLSKEKITSIKGDAYLEWIKDAKLTMIEYSDLECPFCLMQYRNRTIDTILRKYPKQVNYGYKTFRAVQHENSEVKAKALLCVGQIGGTEAYGSYYRKIFDGAIGEIGSQTNLPKDQLLPIAKELWINESVFNECLNSKSVAARYDAQTLEWTNLGVSGTPSTLIINNTTGDYELIPGAYPVDNFIEAINRLLKKR